MGAANEERSLILCPGWRGWPSLAAVLCLLSFISVAAGQDTPQGGGDQNTSAADAAAAGSRQDQGGAPWLGGPGLPSGPLPNFFNRHLVSRFSVGEGYESGIYNSNFTNANDTSPEASASFLYDLKRQHSGYTFDYAGSARRYNRISRLNLVTHQAGLGQVVQWTPRLSSDLRYRFSFTPDFPGSLLQDSVSQDLSLANPSAGSPPLTIPAQQGLVTVRSFSMTHMAQGGLSYQPSLSTRFSVQGDFRRLRYQDHNLFGSDNANISARAERSLTRRTVLGILYGGSWFHQPGGVLGRTITHNGSLFLSQELTRHVTFSATGGRSWSFSTGNQVIPLSPELSDLLGVPVLIRSFSQSFSSWIGSANLLAHWQGVNFGFAYSRAVMNNNLLGRPALTQSFSLNFGKQLGRSSNVAGSIAYQQNDLFTVQNLGRLEQGVASVNFTRKLGSGLDFSMFGNYSRMLHGVQTPFVFNRLQGGIRFAFNLPRVRAS